VVVVAEVASLSSIVVGADTDSNGLGRISSWGTPWQKGRGVKGWISERKGGDEGMDQWRGYR
jgi:hypothetical protein